jgi:hypothetical protein
MRLKTLITCFIFAAFIAFPSVAPAKTGFVGFSIVNGGATGALDAIDCDDIRGDTSMRAIATGDIAFGLTTGGAWYVYGYDATGTDNEEANGPLDPILPDNVDADCSGNGQWDMMSSIQVARSSTPQTIYRDAEATDNDDNVYWTIDCTNPNPASENCDATLTVQIGGAPIDVIHVDADGNIEIALDLNLATGKDLKVNNVSFVDQNVTSGSTPTFTGTNITAAATATALVANGGDCSAGSYPLGVDASGAVESCTDATTEIDSSISTHAAISTSHHTAPTASSLSVDDLITLSGVSEGATHLGTFPGGTTITDNVAVKVALGELEVAVEAAGGHDAVALAADAENILGLSTQEINLDTQTANTVFAGPASGGAVDPDFRALVDDDIPDTVTIDLAGAATALETARTIGGTSFDGTANIVPGTIAVLDDNNVTSYPAFFTTATGDLAPKTDASNYTYNATTGVLTVAGLVGTTDIETALGTSYDTAAEFDTLFAGKQSPGDVHQTGSGTSLPGSCTVGEIFVDTDADTDGSLYICAATDTWKENDDDGAAGGEANTASSQGSGTSIYYQKSSVDLQFNAIKSETNDITVSLDAGTHDVEFTFNPANVPLSELGTGIPNLAADSVDTLTEIATALKSGVDGDLITGTAGTSTYTGVWNVDGDLVDGYDPATKADVSGDTYTGAHDYGGATSVEIPNGTDPDVDADGEISHDTDGANEANDNTLRGYDATDSQQFAWARRTNCFNATIISPNDLDDSERDLFPVWDNNTGMVFTITEIKGWSDTDNTTVNVEVVTATNWTTRNTVDALEIATDGTGVFYVVETTITDATIAHDEMITLDFDDTDTPGVVKVSICGWYNANID